MVAENRSAKRKRPAPLCIRLLGPFQAARGGDVISGFVSDKVRALLAYLVVEQGRPHRREALAGLLWPDVPERLARSSLRTALANLRHVIGDPANPPVLHVTRQTVQFNLASDTQVDVATFSQLLQAASQASGAPVDLQALQYLEDAIALYQGDFLQGFTLSDSVLFEEWAVLKREQLQRQVVTGLRRLAAHHEASGEPVRAMQYAWRVIELDPLPAEDERRMMRLLATSGQREAALAQYGVYAQLLADELGVEPSVQTRALYERIRDGPELGAPRRTPRHNLPAPLIPFVGREAELAQLKERLLDTACRLLTLVGPGGIGKTRLALEVAADLVSGTTTVFSDGVYLVPLASLPAPEAVVPAVAQAIGCRLVSRRGAEQQLIDYLRNKRVLLILDSFEHLLAPPAGDTGSGSRSDDSGGSDLVVRILRAAPHAKLLITSRAALNLEGEHRFTVSGLGFPPSEAPVAPTQAAAGSGSVQAWAPGALDPCALAQYGAVRLFLQGTRRVRPGFEPTPDELYQITRICRLVAGAPLGILLAAAWLQMLAPAEIADQIERSFDFLEADWADVPKRLRSMRAVFDHSFNLLSARERQVFQGLSVFQRGFTAQAAQCVTGASLIELRSLMARSLLSRTSDGRYELHELLRQYAADKLCQTDQLAGSSNWEWEIHHRHSAFYTAALQRWDREFGGPGQQVALVMAEADAANIHAAWHWAVEQEQVEWLDQALEGLEDFYWSGGRYKEGETALRAASTRLLSPAAGHLEAGETWMYRLRVVARILAWQGNFCRLQGDRDRAGGLHQQAMAILDRLASMGQDIRREKALLYWLLGHSALMDDPQRGRGLYEQSLALCRERGDRQGIARALNSLGTAGLFLGALDEARTWSEEALAIYRIREEDRCIARALARLAEIALLQGRIDGARLLAQESVAKSMALGNQPESAFAQLTWGAVLEARGKLAAAESALKTCLAIYQDLGHYNYIASAHSELGSVNLHQGRYAEARAHARTALALARQHGPPFRVGFAGAVLGCVALAQGKPHQARRWLRKSLSVYQTMGARSGPGLGWCQALLGYAARHRGDRDEARVHLGEALRIGAEKGTIKPLTWALPAIALLLADNGEAEQALALWYLAARNPLVAASQWFHDAGGGQLSAIAAALPPDSVAAAQGQARAWDLKTECLELLTECGSGGTGEARWIKNAST